MTEPLNQQPTPQLAAPRKPRRWPWIAGGALALFVVIGVASNDPKPAAPAGDTTPTLAATPVVPAETKTEPATPPPPPAPQGIGQGVHRVPEDVAPGVYKTDGPAESTTPICYWARLKDTTGSLGAVSANGLPQGPATVTILAGDKAFETSGCGPWVKVG